MTNEPTQLVPARHKGGRLRGKQPAAIELSAVSVRPATHFTRVWSATSEEVPFAFRMAVLPVRLLALSLLWSTSSPQRLSIAAAVAGVVAVLVLV